MATEQNPLLSLEPEKQQQLVELVENGNIENIAEQTGLTRRQVLGIGATLAGSGALGGIAATKAVDPAEAQADTADSDGNVGLPTDRVDVFADGVNANSLSTVQSFSESRSSEITVWTDGATIYADGTDSEIASGSDFGAVCQAALNSLSNGGEVHVKAGTYEYSTSVDIPRYCAIRGPGASNDNGMAVIKQADGANLDLFTTSFASLDPAFITIEGLALMGNKANNTSGRAIQFNQNTRDWTLSELFVLNYPDDGIVCQHGWGGKINGVLSERNAGDGLYIGSNGTECKVIGLKSNLNDGHGANSNSAEAKFIACEMRNNGDSGLYLQSGRDQVVVGCGITSNDGSSFNGQLVIDVQEATVDPTTTVKAFSGTDRAIVITNNSTDVDLHAPVVDATTLVADGGTRTRWESQIGGGPLGGVDLSSTTGQYVGDRAVADGTSAATAGALARWTGSAWEYHDPTGTV